MRVLSLSKIALAAAVLACSNALWAQANGKDAPQNVAQLSASGSVDVQQDVLAISLSTTVNGLDASAVQNQLKTALDAALEVAKASSSPGQQDVRTGNFSLQPRYNRDGKMSGWQGSTELILEGKDFPRITSTAGKIQTLTLSNVSFSLSRAQRTKVEAEAQQIAIERFKAKAQEVAKQFGFSAYSLREVNVNANTQNFANRQNVMAMQAKSSMAESPVPVEAGNATVVVNVSGSVQMK